MVEDKIIINFISLTSEILSEYASIGEDSFGNNSTIYAKLAEDFLSMQVDDMTDLIYPGKTEELDVVQPLSNWQLYALLIGDQDNTHYRINWNQQPETYVLTMLKRCGNSLVKLLNAISNLGDKQIVEKELLNIFFRLSSNHPGSFVPIGDVVDRFFSIGNGKDHLVRGPEIPLALTGLMMLLKIKGVPFPAIYHHKFEVFEIPSNLKQILHELVNHEN